MSQLCLQELSIMDSEDVLDSELTQWWLGHDNVESSQFVQSSVDCLAILFAASKETV
jgi:hypothetical protein